MNTNNCICESCNHDDHCYENCKKEMCECEICECVCCNEVTADDGM